MQPRLNVATPRRFKRTFFVSLVEFQKDCPDSSTHELHSMQAASTKMFKLPTTSTRRQAGPFMPFLAGTHDVLATLCLATRDVVEDVPLSVEKFPTHQLGWMNADGILFVPFLDGFNPLTNIGVDFQLANPLPSVSRGFRIPASRSFPLPGRFGVCRRRCRDPPRRSQEMRWGISRRIEEVVTFQVVPQWFKN